MDQIIVGQLTEKGEMIVHSDFSYRKIVLKTEDRYPSEWEFNVHGAALKRLETIELGYLIKVRYTCRLKRQANNNRNVLKAIFIMPAKQVAAEKDDNRFNKL